MYETTEKSTQHGYKTPYGYSTPHRYPTTPGNNFTDIFEGLVRQLYPTGRAWYMKKGGVFNLLHKAINVNFIRFVEDCGFFTDSLFPDNVNFDENDAEIWEYRLGLITNKTVPLEERKQAILRKMAYPGNQRARQHPLYIQHQLQLAGFNVYIHENRFFEGGQWVYKTPEQIGVASTVATQHGNGTQHGGGTQHGATGYYVIANTLEPVESYAVGGYNNLWATFFIGGENLGDYADVPENRLIEFKELVLKLKPAHTVAFTFINYV